MENSAPQANSSQSKIDQLAAHASEEDAANAFMNPVKGKKRGTKAGSKRGPYKKSETPREQEHEVVRDPQAEIDAIKPILKPLVEIIDSAGVKIAETEEARMGEEVMQCLIDTGAACVHQYLPDMVGQHANLIVLTMTFSNWSLKVYMLRMRELERLKAEFREKYPQGKPPEDPKAVL